VEGMTVIPNPTTKSPQEEEPEVRLL